MLYSLTLAAVGVALLVGAVAFAWTLARNMRVGEEFYQIFAEQLESLRLARALKMFGLEPRRYLRSQRVVDMELQMRRCAGCQDTEACDECIETGDCGERFRFCPNYDILQKKRLSAPELTHQTE